MKKFGIGIVLVLLALTLPLSAFAQEPPANLEEDDERGNPNSFVTTDLPFSKAVQALAGKLVNFNIIGDVITEVTKQDEVNVTDMSPFNTWLANPFRDLNPFAIKNNSIAYTEENPESGRWCAILVIKSDNVVRVREDYVTEPDTMHMSANIPWSQDLYTYGKDLASKYSGYRLGANTEGKIDYNSSKKFVKHISTEDCGANFVGVEHEVVKVDARQRAEFGEQSTIQTSVINTLYDYVVNKITEALEQVIKTMGVTMSVRLTKKTQISNSPLAGCLLGIGCGPKENAPQVINHSTTPNDGMPAMLVAASQRKKPIGYGGSPNTVHLGGDASKKGFDYVNPEAGINRAYESLRQARCSVTPSKFTSTDKIGGIIPIAEACAAEKPALCPIDVIEEKFNRSSDGSCNLCSQSSAKQYMNPDQAAAFGSGLSPLGVKVLQAAADTYKVPASVLLATMLHEGAFNHPGAWKWSSDDTIREFSDCTQTSPMPSCETFAGSEGAKGAFGFIDSWWSQYMGTDKDPYNGRDHKAEIEGLQEMVKTVPRENFSPCNFTDATFMAAREISEDSSHVFEEVPPSCTSTQYGTINFYQGTDLPFSCGAWTSERVATTRLQYAEGIAEGTCSPAGADFTNDIGRMVAMYGDLTCGQ